MKYHETPGVRNLVFSLNVASTLILSIVNSRVNTWNNQWPVRSLSTRRRDLDIDIYGDTFHGQTI